jgi:sulfite exporter TauE/SafE
MGTLLGLMFGAGIASGVHCVGMCGGIVAAFDSRRVIPVTEIRPASYWFRRIAFNAGRISTYAAAGAVGGTLGAAAYAATALDVQATLALVVNVMLVLVGLYLAGAGRLLGRLEALGAPLWRRLQPLAAVLLSGRTLGRAYAAGLVWGWLPCAMVYAAMAAAAFSGSASGGALAMAAFGFGTLPFLLAAGWLAGRLRAWRVLAGGLVLGFGVYGLAHAGGFGASIRQTLLCL